MSLRSDLDAQLSAWIDGELPEAEARALAERVAREPELAARAGALRRVNEALRALPAPEPAPDLRQRLEARLAAGEGEGEERGMAVPAGEAEARGVVVPLRVRRWALPAAAALAAGLALYLSARTAPPRPGAPELAPPPEIVRSPEPAPTPARETPEPARLELAREPEPAAAPDPPESVAPERPGGADPTRLADAPAEDAAQLADAPAEDAEDGELALALDYELLRDFEVIDQLELLEVLAAYEDLEGEGRS